ncbi:hypothetical protein JOM56_014828 [Amanita muscaria]
MFRSALYSLLLLPAFLLRTTSASIRWDSISTVQYPKYYVVHNGNEAVGDLVKLAKRTDQDDGYSAPPGSNLVVYQNGSISDPNGNLFLGAGSNYTTLIWASEPLSWEFLELGPGFSPYAWENPDTLVCWHHTTDATTVELEYCPFKGERDEIEYSWAWD